MKREMVLTNMDIGDMVFESDHGHWNVTRAERLCQSGKVKLYSHSVGEVLLANLPVEVDAAKVARYRTMPEVLRVPGIFVIEGGAMWFIEGHHRLRAMAENGAEVFEAFVIEEELIAPLIVRYNGQRLPPWAK
jgi:hypothetical protein